MADLMTIAQYAAARGITAAAVYEALKAGRIETIEFDGKRWLHPDLADAQWAKNTQHSKARRKHPAAPAVEAPSKKPEAPDPPRSESPESSYMDARTRREKALAELAELELARTRGDLVDAARVRTGAMRMYRMLRDALLGLPAQMAPELAAIDNPRLIDAQLTQRFRSLLEDLEKVAKVRPEDNHGQEAA